MQRLRSTKQNTAIDQTAEIDAVVYVVDDDPTVREYVQWLLRTTPWRVETYPDAESFLSSYRDTGPGCLITDLYMPGLSGLDLQERLAEEGIDLPIIMMSGQAEIGTAVRAMREGAVDFLEKPFDGEALLARVRATLKANYQARASSSEKADVAGALERLTPRQRAVLDGLMAGKPSKIIAADLGVSPRTIDVHRFRLMRALGAESLPDLFRLVVLVRGKGAEPAGDDVTQPPDRQRES